eukprot:8796746-Lingulodinium_polyedra.AAC.1
MGPSGAAVLATLGRPTVPCSRALPNPPRRCRNCDEALERTKCLGRMPGAPLPKLRGQTRQDPNHRAIAGDALR